MPDSEKKDDLVDRLDELQDEIDGSKIEEDKLTEATEAVKKAEEERTQGSVDAAQKLVDNLTEGDDKTELQNRLDVVQKELDQKADTEATEAVEAAVAAVQTTKEKEEALKKAVDDDARQKASEALATAVKDEQQKFDHAQQLVKNLSDKSEVKAGLQDRLDDIIAGYAKKYVELAEKAITQSSIDKAREYVNKLPTDKLSDYPERLDKVLANLNTINAARAAVEKAERTKNQADIESARDLVYNVGQIEGQQQLAAGFTNRLDEVEKGLLKSELAASIKAAEEAVVETSVDGKDILTENQWVSARVNDDFQTAIEVAKGVYDDFQNASLKEVKGAKTALDAAKTTYEGARENGTLSLLAAAIAAVEEAEKITDETSYEDAKGLYDTAKELVDKIADSTEKTGLEERLEAVDAIIQATAAVVKVEEKTTLTNIRAAEELVEKVADGDVKTALENRLAELNADTKTTGDLNDAIDEAQKHIKLQEDSDGEHYTGDSYEKFKDAYDAALEIQAKEGSATADQLTLSTENLLEAMENLIEAEGPALKDESENPDPAGKQTVELDLKPTISNPSEKQVTSGGLVGLHLGVIDLGLISASQIDALSGGSVHKVKVEKDTTFNADLTVAIHTVLGGQAFDIGIYKEDENGDYKRIDLLSGSSGGFLGIASTAKFTLDTLDEGDYLFVLDLGGGLSVVQGVPFKVINQVVRDYGKSAEGVEATGALLSDWALGGKDEAVVSHIKVGSTIENPRELEKDGKTTIQGRYGQLIIGRDGEYKYIPANVPTNIGKVETFEYTVTNTHNGKTATSELQIRIGAETVEWDENDWGKDVTVVEAKSTEQSTKIKASNVKNTVTSPDTRTGLGIWYNRTLESEHIEIQDKTSELTFDIRKNLSAKEANVQVKNIDTGEVVYDENKSISSAGENIKLTDLDAGTYKITAKGIGSMGGSTGRLQNIKVTSPTWGQYTVDNSETLKGNIREIEGNKLGEKADLKTVLSVRGYLVEDGNTSPVQTYHKLDKGAKVIAGKYGVLTVQENGSYEYKPNANVAVAGQADVFAYKLTHASGIESEATLTFKINPLKDYTDNADILSGTTAAETITGGKGSDTLVYNVLKEDATGGNQHDTWSDFHYGTIATDVDADRVDLRLLFEGQRIDNLESYVQVTQKGKSILIQVDRDGPSGKYDFTDLLTLKGDNLPEGKISIQDLIDNGQLIVQ